MAHFKILGSLAGTELFVGMWDVDQLARETVPVPTV